MDFATLRIWGLDGWFGVVFGCLGECWTADLTGVFAYYIIKIKIIILTKGKHYANIENIST